MKSVSLINPLTLEPFEKIAADIKLANPWRMLVSTTFRGQTNSRPQKTGISSTDNATAR